MEYGRSVRRISLPKIVAVPISPSRHYSPHTSQPEFFSPHYNQNQELMRDITRSDLRHLNEQQAPAPYIEDDNEQAPQTIT